MLTVPLALALLVVPPLQASHGNEGGNYVAAEGLALYCGAGGHDVVPQGPPDLDRPANWLLSGEPECAPGDVLFGTEEEHGIGGLGFYPHVGPGLWQPPRDHRGDIAVATAADAAFAAPAMYVQIEQFEREDVDIETCGPVAFQVPPEDNNGFFAPVQTGWVFLPVAMVTADLDACFASTGHLQIAYAG